MLTETAGIKELNSRRMSGKGPVLYWMSRDQRLGDNRAFLHAAGLAAEAGCGIEVVFTLSPVLYGNTLRALDFMLGGLREVEKRAAELSVVFKILSGPSGENPYEMVKLHADRRQAAAVVCDFNPLREGLSQHKALSSALSVPVIEVDAHNIVPCRYVSNKQEYGAFTLRRKIEPMLPHFLVPFPDAGPLLEKAGVSGVPGGPVNDWDALERQYPSDKSVNPVETPAPGYSSGMKALYGFIENRLGAYAEQRNDPNKDAQSGLSPYLHFGQIAPQTAALEAARFLGDASLKGGFLDEIIVRRELSDNFCLYNPDYDSYRGFPAWAGHSLGVHALDEREYKYSTTQFEQAETHDQLWNAAQLQLVNTGRIHGYMRMYWAKKILEWSKTPPEAMNTAVYLNDKYALDGKDPNGYAGCAWSIGGLHDRAWTEREVFGKIRYMNEKGCRRKFDADAYISRWSNRFRRG